MISEVEQIQELEKVLPQAWTEATSAYTGIWSRNNPASGQGAITAALVQEKLGGEIVRVVWSDLDRQNSHYFNILPGGVRVDLTYSQFPSTAQFAPPMGSSDEELIAATRAYLQSKDFGGSAYDYILSFPETRARFDALKQNYENARQRTVGQELAEFLPRAWSGQTSSDRANWSTDNPAWGQCAVTAALVQERLGGEIVRVISSDRGQQNSHYLNILPDGQRRDFTQSQFSPTARFEPSLDSSNSELITATQAYLKGKGFKGSAYDYVLSFPATRLRFDTLKGNYEAAKYSPLGREEALSTAADFEEHAAYGL